MNDVESKIRGYDNLLEYKDENISITIPIKVCKMSEQEIYPKIIMRDIKGQMIKKCQVNRENNEPLPPYNYKYKNEVGEIIEKHDIHYFKVEDTQETEIKPFPATIGKGRRLLMKAKIPKEQSKEYLFSEGYSILPKNHEDTQALWGIAKDMLDKDVCVVVEIIHREGFTRHWGIIDSTIKEDMFSMNLLTTTKKIQPNDIPIPKTVMITPKVKVMEKSLF